MVRSWRNSAIILVLVSLIIPLQALAQSDKTEAERNLKIALKHLNSLSSSWDSQSRARIPAFRSILTRYYLDNESIRESEAQIAEAIIKGMPDGDGRELASRDAGDKLKELQELLKKKTPGIATKAHFVGGTRNTPTGKNMGFVDVNIDGRNRTVVEILAGPKGFSVGKRADIIAKDMNSLQQLDSMWWTQLSNGRVNREWVVKTPKAPRGYIITADADFAKEWGLSPQGLSGQLITTIRRTFDPKSGSNIALRGDTPEQRRDDAVALRSQADQAYAKRNKQAEKLYRRAIETDPSYGVAYLRLAALLKAQGRKSEASTLLNSGLNANGLKPDDKAELTRALKGL